MDSSSCREYDYSGEHIDPDRAIRVLHLLPGNFEDDIHCSTCTQSIDCCGKSEGTPSTRFGPPQLPYDALSYAWGDTSRRKSVYSNHGEQLLVMENLWNALRRLKSTTTTRRLWIDQLCIDQKCSYERSLQISHMDCIYRHAGNVLIWLGDSGRQDNRPPESHRQMYKQIEKAIMNTQPSWWSRAWVVQEFVMAKHQRIFCFGTCTLAYEDFKGLFFNQTIIRALSFRSFRPMEIIEDHFHAFMQLAETKDIKSIVHRLRILALADCADPKDKVYSLLALMTGEEKALIQSRYDLSLEAVYAETTFAWVAAPKNLSALVLVHAAGSEPKQGFPTWAIDFQLLQTNSLRLWPLQRLDMKRLRALTMEMKSNVPSDGFGLEEKISTPWCRTSPWCDAVVAFDPERLTLTFAGLAFDRVALSFDIDCESTATSLMQEGWVGGLDGAATSTPAKSWSLYSLTEWRVYKAITRLITKGDPYRRLKAQHNEPSQNMHSKTSTAMNEDINIGMISRLFREWDNAHSDNGHKFSTFTITRCAASMFRGATLFITHAGFLGLGPPGIKRDDHVVLPYGSRHPICLREVQEDENLWDFQGLTYVHGIMEGELLTRLPDFELVERRFVLR